MILRRRTYKEQDHHIYKKNNKEINSHVKLARSNACIVD